MRIAIVGGLDRNAGHLESLARRHGHRLEHHHGRMTGPSSSGLKAAVARADRLVIVTDVNSHAAVGRAKDLARRKGVPVTLVRRLREVDLEAIFATPELKEAA